jgi:hypothetical protein
LWIDRLVADFWWFRNNEQAFGLNQPSEPAETAATKKRRH